MARGLDLKELKGLSETQTLRGKQPLILQATQIPPTQLALARRQSPLTQGSGSLSWIMSPSTPKTKRRPYNPAYSLKRGSSSEDIGWRHPGTVETHFPTAYCPVKPVLPEILQTIVASESDTTIGGIQTSPIRTSSGSITSAEGGIVSPGGSRIITRRLTESAAQRTRNKGSGRESRRSKTHGIDLPQRKRYCAVSLRGKATCMRSGQRSSCQGL